MKSILECMNNEEVIGLQIDNTIYFGQTAIDMCLKYKRCDNYYTRGTFYFMDYFDLSPQWKCWAETAPTLFLKSDLERFEK